MQAIPKMHPEFVTSTLNNINKNNFFKNAFLSCIRKMHLEVQANSEKHFPFVIRTLRNLNINDFKM